MNLRLEDLYPSSQIAVGLIQWFTECRISQIYIGEKGVGKTSALKAMMSKDNSGFIHNTRSVGFDGGGLNESVHYRLQTYREMREENKRRAEGAQASNWFSGTVEVFDGLYESDKMAEFCEVAELANYSLASVSLDGVNNLSASDVVNLFMSRLILHYGGSSPMLKHIGWMPRIIVRLAKFDGEYCVDSVSEIMWDSWDGARGGKFTVNPIMRYDYTLRNSAVVGTLSKKTQECMLMWFDGKDERKQEFENFVNKHSLFGRRRG